MRWIVVATLVLFVFGCGRDDSDVRPVRDPVVVPLPQPLPPFPTPNPTPIVPPVPDPAPVPVPPAPVPDPAPVPVPPAPIPDPTPPVPPAPVPPEDEIPPHATQLLIEANEHMSHLIDDIRRMMLTEHEMMTREEVIKILGGFNPIEEEELFDDMTGMSRGTLLTWKFRMPQADVTGAVEGTFDTEGLLVEVGGFCWWNPE